MRDPALSKVYVDYFNDTHGMVRDTMRRFVTEAVKPNIDAWEEAGTFPREVYQQAGSLGLQCGVAVCLALSSAQGWTGATMILGLSILLGMARALQMPAQQFS